LETEKAESKNRKGGGALNLGGIGGHNRNRSMAFSNTDYGRSKENEELINFLEHKLEEIEKKYKKT
jgi:hypothetical protein